MLSPVRATLSELANALINHSYVVRTFRIKIYHACNGSAPAGLAVS